MAMPFAFSRPPLSFPKIKSLHGLRTSLPGNNYGNKGVPQMMLPRNGSKWLRFSQQERSWDGWGTIMTNTIHDTYDISDGPIINHQSQGQLSSIPVHRFGPVISAHITHHAVPRVSGKQGQLIFSQ